MRHFDAFMTPIQEIIDFYSTLVQDTSQFHIAPWGVDTEFFHPMDKESAKNEVAGLLNMPEIKHEKIVGFISRFEVEKGAGIFINAARLMPDTTFVAIGLPDGANDYDLPRNLVAIGKQPREKTRIFYNAFDVFCFPSIASTETFGLVALEAMACGTAIVVSTYDGPKYIVGDGGVIVDGITFHRDMASLGGYASPYDFAEAIAELLKNDAKREKMAQRAREISLEFTWDHTARKLLQIFDKLSLRKTLGKRAASFPIGFSLKQPPDGSVQPKSIIINMARENNVPLVGGLYDTSIEEGIALALLKNHSIHEVEVVLQHLLRDPDSVAEQLRRIRGFQEALF